MFLSLSLSAFWPSGNSSESRSGASLGQPHDEGIGSEVPSELWDEHRVIDIEIREEGVIMAS